MSGLCECGCGQSVERVKRTRRGAIAGEYRRFVSGHQMQTAVHQGPQYRIEDRGHDTPCWIWLRAMTGRGYGAYGRDGGPAHRVYFERVHGPIPEGMELDHLCRVRACVNPEHLEPVTRAENARRSPLVAKLQIEDVRAIRGSAESDGQLAVRYGVARQTVNDIRNGRKWKGITNVIHG